MTTGRRAIVIAPGINNGSILQRPQLARRSGRQRIVHSRQAPACFASADRVILARQGETGMNDPVDVLIIGAGASGAAVAWSLAETKMHILCLEQGGWMNPATYPSTGRDWEARFFGDFSPSPNIRARPEDYPINDDNSPIKVVNFNGVGGGTIMYTAHFPRLHPSDFRVRSLDGVADDWPVDYDMLAPFFEENDRMMGVSGLAGDPGVPPRLNNGNPPMPPLPLGRSGRACWARR